MTCLRVRQAEDIGEILEVLVMAGKSLAAHGPFIQAEGLDLRAHRAIEQQDALGEQRFELVGFIGHRESVYGEDISNYVSIIVEINGKTRASRLRFDD